MQQGLLSVALVATGSVVVVGTRKGRTSWSVLRGSWSSNKNSERALTDNDTV